ncbi:aldo/keto reductase [bacterium]|nr:aldo/keto reductase [bacterium]
MHLEPTVKLRGNVQLPRMGLGVWKLPAVQTLQVVGEALAAGYRHIDTAKIYGNEAEVGEAIRASGLARKTVFVTSKLWTDDHSKARAAAAFDESLQRLGTEWVDLFLSHFPVTGKRVETWQALQQIVNSGKCRAVGVSNYTVRHLQELMDRTHIIPAVNQVEFHPFLFQKDLLDFSRQHNIHLMAYSPLVHGHYHDNPVLRSVAQAHRRSVPQVMLRWLLQHGLSVIPKTTQKTHMIENLAVFDFQLSESEMEQINGLDQGLRTCWDPTQTP